VKESQEVWECRRMSAVAWVDVGKMEGGVLCHEPAFGSLQRFVIDNVGLE